MYVYVLSNVISRYGYSRRQWKKKKIKKQTHIVFTLFSTYIQYIYVDIAMLCSVFRYFFISFFL